jgi:phenylalanyl-tRNA synthetase beta chain
MPTWREPQPRHADFFAVKGAVQGLLDALGAVFEIKRAQAPFVYPGRAASVWIGGEAVGWLGELHPLVAAEWEIDDSVAAFEINLDAVPEPPAPTYEDVTSFPEVREDLAVVVSEQVSAAQVLDLVQRAGAPLLAAAEVFDVYRDPERVGEGNVSLALRLSYRAPDRTLTDEEVAERREAIGKALSQELGGRVRAA